MNIYSRLKSFCNLVRSDFSFAILFCAAALIAFVVSAYAVNFFGWFSSSKEVWGQFGDYVGGLLNPVLSFMALIAIVKSLKYQSEEVKEARSEANAAMLMQKEQTKIFKQQSFESVFFGLVDLYSKAVESMERYEVGKVYKGISVARRLSYVFNIDRIEWGALGHEKISVVNPGRIPVIQAHANKFLEAVQQDGLKAFTVLEQLLSYVDSCDLDDASLKDRYVLIVKSLLTPAEVECALLYCLSDEGAKMKSLMESYSLFSNSPKRVGDAYLRNCRLIKW